MPIAPTNGPLLLELQRATHATLRELATELADLRLDAPETNLLGNLADGQPRTATELAVATGSRPTTLTSVLDRLETRGLVTRERHPTDRRSVHIRLTPDGAAAATRVDAAMRAIEQRRLDRLTREQRAALAAALGALAEGS